MLILAKCIDIHTSTHTTLPLHLQDQGKAVAIFTFYRLISQVIELIIPRVAANIVNMFDNALK